MKGLVEGMGANNLARVGDAVVDCDTGDKLLETAKKGSGNSVCASTARSLQTVLEAAS